jgi:hypothetical protein
MQDIERQNRGQIGKATRHPSPVANVRSPATTTTGEVDLTADEAMNASTELFSSLPNPNKTNRRRRYVLELEDGELVFRRHELERLFEDILNEIFGPNRNTEGDDIVPQKLSTLFPGRRRSKDR